jgi:hypothetical protein
MAEQSLAAVVSPGTYFVDHDGSTDTTLRVGFTVAADDWRAWTGTYTNAEGGAGDGRSVGLTIADLSEVVADPCLDHSWTDPGPGVEVLAAALAALPAFDVSEPPSAASLAGFAGRHLQLRVPAIAHEPDRGFLDCVGNRFYGWRGDTAHRRILERYYQAPGNLADFWILDVEGTRLLIETVKFADSPADDLAELQAILDSIRIEP